MSDNPNLKYDDGVWFVEGEARISPGGKPGVNAGSSEYRPYNLPGEEINDGDGSIVSDEFVIAWGGQAKQPVTSNKWWSPALLQKRSKLPKVGQWIEAKGEASQRSRPMFNEPFCMNFVDMAGGGYPEDLWQHGLRLWNQSDMYVFADQPGATVDSERFVIDNLAQSDAPIVTVGLHGVHPLQTNDPTKASSVVIDDYSEFHVDMGYGDGTNELAIRMASGVPYVIFERVKGKAPFQLWAGSPVTDVGENENKDTYREWTPKNKSALGFDLGVRFLPGPPAGMKPVDPPPRGQAAYYVLADKGAWKKKEAKYGAQDYYTWINDEATTVWVLALPHNLTTDAEFQGAVDVLMASPAKSYLASGVLYPPEIRNPVVVNGEIARVGYDQEHAKIIVGYHWEFRECGAPFLALFPHHRKFMREQDMQCFLMHASAKDLKGNPRPRYFYRTFKGEMWVYKGNEFVREFEARGLLPFSDTLWAMYPEYAEPYKALRTWFWNEEPLPGGAHCDSFAWNYFEHGGPEANPYMNGWPGLYENLIIADQLARLAYMTGDGGEPDDIPAARGIDPDFKTSPARVAVVMREKILEVLKQLVHQWFDVYTSQCLQYNDKFATVCGYPEGFKCVSHLCDHHFHWGYFLRAAAAIGRFDRPWLDRHWPAIEMLMRDSANFDPMDKRFPLQRNFSAFYGHSWANGIAFNNGQDQESTSEALNLAFGMVELATLRNDSDMLAVGLWLYEEQVCATQQYWFNVDAETDPDRLQKLETRGDLYYNGNWPKRFVRFSRKDAKTGKDVLWNSTLVGIVGQQSVSKQLHFEAGTQGLYAIHMLPVGPSNLYLEREKDWLEETYRGYLQAAGQAASADPSRSPYENIIAMWQMVVSPSASDQELPEFDRPGFDGASKRINRSHPKFAGAVKSQALAWCIARHPNHQGPVLDDDVRSNAVHYAAFKRTAGDPGLYCLVYNPHHTDPLSARFWFAGKETFKTTEVPPRTLQVFGLHADALDPTNPKKWRVGENDLYTPFDASVPPVSRLYLHSHDGGYTLDRGLGADQKFQPPNLFPTDLSALQSSIADLPRGLDKAAPENFEKPLVFKGKFSGKLAKDFRYTKFSLFVNPALHAGWTRDPSNPDAGVEMRITYDFGNGKKRVETYGPTQKFNLQPNNTWLNHNCLTEYATTTVPLWRPASENPLTPEIEGDDFQPEVTNGTITLEIQKTAHTTSKSPVPVYLSLNCPHEPERASWIQPPYL
jgi:hypothetical protein